MGTASLSRGDVRVRARSVVVAVGLLAFVWPSDAGAHSSSSKSHEDGLPRGVEIPSIAHSDMEVLSRYRPEIIALAERQVKTDDRMRRLLNFSKIQYTYCLWGIVPGALRDEENNFNTCSHAYLASAWALLQHMETMPMARGEAVELKRSVDAALSSVPVFSLCASSADIFYTDQVIVPPGTYAAAGGLSGLLLLMGVAPFVWANRRNVR